MTQRPADPDVLYERFTRHIARCNDCGTRGTEHCSTAEALLMEWRESERFYATEQARIDAASDWARNELFLSH